MGVSSTPNGTFPLIQELNENLSPAIRDFQNRVDAQLLLFNVKAYGAVGDGVTDDYASFAAAIAAANALGGGTVWIPASEEKYVIGTTIVLPDNVNLTGQGIDAVIILRKSTLTANLFSLAGANCSASGFTVDGNYPNRASGVGSEFEISGDRSEIRYVKIINPFFIGIGFGAATDAKILHCQLYGLANGLVGSIGIWANHPTIIRPLVHKCYFQDWTLGGVYAGATDMLIDHCDFFRNHWQVTGPGLTGGGHIACGEDGTGASGHVTVRDCVIEGGGGAEASGLEIDNGPWTVENVRIKDTTNWSVILQGVAAGGIHRLSNVHAEGGGGVGPEPDGDFSTAIAADRWTGFNNTPTTMNNVFVGGTNVAASKVVFTDTNSNLTTTGTIGATQGGTGTGTAFTPGSVVFMGATGYAEDNAGIFYDDTNNRLGVGIATPSRQFHLHSTANTVLQITDAVSGFTASHGFQLQQAGLTTYLENTEAGSMILRTSATDRITITAAGLVGIKMAPVYNLDVNGGVNAFRVKSSSALVTDTIAAWENSAGIVGIVRANGAMGLGVTAPDARLHVLATTEQLRLGYDASIYAKFTVDNGGNLTVAPTGDYIFNPTGKDILPNTNYDLNVGSPTKKYLTLHAAELWVETLVAQNTIATIGGRILVGPTTVLTSDLAAAGTSIVVKHNQMVSGERVYMEADGKVEFMAITSAPSGGGPYTYTVTRNLDGSGANDWNAGDAVFNTGQAGNGFMDIYSVRGVKAGTELGPTIAGNVRNGTTYNDWSTAWAIGNLDGVYGYSGTTFGVAFGKYGASLAHITIDATNGYRIFNSTINIVGQWDNAGTLKLGTNIGAAATTKFLISNATQTYNSESLVAGDVLFGDNTAASNLGNIKISAAGVIKIRRGVTDYITLDATDAQFTNLIKMTGASAAIALGTPPPTSASAGDGIWLDRTGMYGLDGSVVQAKFDAATGRITGGASNVALDAFGLQVVGAVDAGFSAQHAYNNVASIDGNVWSAFYDFNDPIESGHQTIIRSNAIASRDTILAIFADAPTGKTSTLDLGSWINGAPVSGINIDQTAITFSTGSFTERARILPTGNIKIAGTAVRGTTEGTNHLDIFNGTSPAGTLTNGISIYARAGECYIMDAAGNETIQSPHEKETGEWIFWSKNTITGRCLRVDMERLVKAIDKNLGGGFVKEFMEPVN